MANASPSEAFKHYQLLGTLGASTRHLGTIDHMLRRAAWKERHGTFDMTVEELLYRSVSAQERAAGVQAPMRQTTLKQELATKLSAEHDRREATGWKNRMAVK